MGKRRRKSRNRRNPESAPRMPEHAPKTLPDGGKAHHDFGEKLAGDTHPPFEAFARPSLFGPVIGPEWWRRPAIWIVAAGILVLSFWLLRPVLTTIAFAFGVAYFVSPLVDLLERRRIPRAVSIAAIIIGVIALFAGGLAILIPVVQNEIGSLVKNVPEYWEKGNAYFTSTIRPFVFERTGYELPTTARDVWDRAGTKLTGIAPDLAGKAAEFLKATLSNVFGLLGALINLLLFPVFLFYILKDFPRIKESISDAVPPRHRPFLGAKLKEVDRVLNAFVRGQLTVAIFLAIAYSSGLLIARIDMPIVIGTISGLAFVIPYAGTVLGIVVASVMAIARFGIDWHLAVVIGTYGIAQFAETNFITPKLVGEQVGLHPIVMITAVIVGGTLFGFLGVLLAVPATAVAAVFWRSGITRYKSSDFYLARR